MNPIFDRPNALCHGKPRSRRLLSSLAETSFVPSGDNPAEFIGSWGLILSAGGAALVARAAEAAGARVSRFNV